MLWGGRTSHGGSGGCAKQVACSLAVHATGMCRCLRLAASQAARGTGGCNAGAVSRHKSIRTNVKPTLESRDGSQQCRTTAPEASSNLFSNHTCSSDSQSAVRAAWLGTGPPCEVLLVQARVRVRLLEGGRASNGAA